MAGQGRRRNPNRELAKQQYLDTNGQVSTAELAAMAGVTPQMVRRWRKDDDWEGALIKKRKGGAPKGNKNAAGHGAPKGNQNAVTHGAYATVHLDSLPPERRAYIETITLDTQANMLRELQILMAKEADLQEKISRLQEETPDNLHMEKVVEMLVPSGKNKSGESKTTAAMTTVVKASPFDWTRKLEAELNKVHGRIIKLLDSIKSYELDQRRIQLEERKYRLNKQKMEGVFEVDPESGEIIDDIDLDDEGEGWQE